MHIFRNTNKNPNEELLNIFLSTDKKEIRDYVGDFLLTVGKLKKIFHDSWILLEAVEVSEKRELILGSGSYNLLKVHELAHNYKCFLAGELFLISFGKFYLVNRKNLIFCFYRFSTHAISLA